MNAAEVVVGEVKRDGGFQVCQPDWLCERIVEELLPKHGFKAMLDPSCGSGSFLRAGINHFLTHNTEGTENDRLRKTSPVSQVAHVLACGEFGGSRIADLLHRHNAANTSCNAAP